MQFKENLAEEKRLPELGPLQFYTDCFNELSTCRGMGGPIPFTSIVEFARIYEIDDFEDFNIIIRMIDDFYLAANEKKVNNASQG